MWSARRFVGRVESPRAGDRDQFVHARVVVDDVQVEAVEAVGDDADATDDACRPCRAAARRIRGQAERRSFRTDAAVAARRTDVRTGAAGRTARRTADRRASRSRRGLKFSCTIWLAVRVENALPSGRQIGAGDGLRDGREGGPAPRTLASPPPHAARPEIVNVVAAPVMRNTASTLPTRSTTAIVAGAPRACASCTACAITCCTSATVSADVAAARLDDSSAGRCRCPLAAAAGWRRTRSERVTAAASNGAVEASLQPPPVRSPRPAQRADGRPRVPRPRACLIGAWLPAVESVARDAGRTTRASPRARCPRDSAARLDARDR